MIARASSGSSSSINSIEPLMSANSAVTVLRSPSGRPSVSRPDGMRSGCSDNSAEVDLTEPDAALPMLSGAAHSSQNFAPGRLPAPQQGQLTGIGAAQSLQNFAPSRLSAPQLEQRTAL